jgi:hypothetical protein
MPQPNKPAFHAAQSQNRNGIAIGSYNNKGAKMQKLINALANLGTVSGMTFRAVPQEGVGMLIEPNPVLTRAQVGVFEVRPPPPPRVTGDWRAKPLHVTW